MFLYISRFSFSQNLRNVSYCGNYDRSTASFFARKERILPTTLLIIFDTEFGFHIGFVWKPFGIIENGIKGAVKNEFISPFCQLAE